MLLSEARLFVYLLPHVHSISDRKQRDYWFSVSRFLYFHLNFAGQITALSLCMIQYNILGSVKRFESYETIGGLFAELTGETLELTVVQRIWGLIIEVINVIAEFFSCDPFELTENVINNNHQIKAVKLAFDRLDLTGAAA